MTIRTTKRTVTFEKPFVLGGSDEALPAGSYSLETDEELLEDISFPAYRRKSTRLYVPATRDQPGVTRILTIDPSELEAALCRDEASARNPADMLADQGPTVEKATGSR